MKLYHHVDTLITWTYKKTNLDPLYTWDMLIMCLYNAGHIIIHIFADALLHRICHFFSYNSITEKKNGFYFCSMFVLFSPPNRWMWLKVGKQLPWPLMEEKLSPPPPKYILHSYKFDVNWYSWICYKRHGDIFHHDLLLES
jgi:hypothetical protein